MSVGPAGSPGTSTRTTLQSLLDLHEDRDLETELSLELSGRVMAPTTFETWESNEQDYTQSSREELTHPSPVKVVCDPVLLLVRVWKHFLVDV